MSADNGVYILASRGPKKRRGYTKEYRVVHTQATTIESILEPDDTAGNGVESEWNQENALRIFGNARVFTDRRVAEGYAQAILDRELEQGDVVEHGIVFLDCMHLRFPKSEDGQSRSPSHRRAAVR